MREIRCICIVLVHWVFFAQSSHFYGGTVTWKAMITNTTSSKIPVMFIQSYQWRRSFGPSTYCDQSVILNQSPKIGSPSDQLKCVSSACGGYQALNVAEYCTDYSTLVDSSSGLIANIENITAGSKFCVAYQAGAWTTLQSTKCSAGRRKRRGHGGGGGGGDSGSKTTVSTTTVAGCSGSINQTRWSDQLATSGCSHLA